MSEEPLRSDPAAAPEASPAPTSAPSPEASAEPTVSPEAARAFARAKWIVLLAVTLAVVGLDQWSKHWAQGPLRDQHAGRLTVIEGYLDFAYVRNPGAAWGFLARSPESFRQPFFVVISLAAMLFILYIHWRLEPGQRALLLALSLVLGGAVGNFIDRVRFRYVVDFIEAHLRFRYKWPTFNVADIAITLGVMLLVGEMLFGPWWRRRRHRRRLAQRA